MTVRVCVCGQQATRFCGHPVGHRTCRHPLCDACAGSVGAQDRCWQHTPANAPPSAPIIALTVLQPFASALILGVKRGENRTWAPPRFTPGSWVAVHAGTTPYRKDGIPLSRSSFTMPQASRPALWPDMPAQLPHGGLIGMIQLERIVRHERAESYDNDPWLVGPVIWMVSTVIPFSKPIPCPGSQGLWRVQGKAYEQCLQEWNGKRHL